MASGRKSVSHRDYLVLTTRELAGCRRRPLGSTAACGTPSAVRSLEERLAVLGARIESHLAESDGPTR